MIHKKIKQHHIKMPTKFIEKNTAWILEIQPEDLYEAQRYLFSLGFKWFSGLISHDDVKQLSSIFDRDIRDNRLTYSIDNNIIRTSQIVKDYSGKNEYHRFKWFDYECQYINTIEF